MTEMSGVPGMDLYADRVPNMQHVNAGQTPAPYDFGVPKRDQEAACKADEAARDQMVAFIQEEQKRQQEEHAAKKARLKKQVEARAASLRVQTEQKLVEYTVDDTLLINLYVASQMETNRATGQWLVEASSRGWTVTQLIDSRESIKQQIQERGLTEKAQRLLRRANAGLDPDRANEMEGVDMASAVPVPSQPGRMFIPDIGGVVQQDLMRDHTYRVQANEKFNKDVSPGRLASRTRFKLTHLLIEPDETFIRCKREGIPLSAMKNDIFQLRIGSCNTLVERSVVELMDVYWSIFEKGGSLDLARLRECVDLNDKMDIHLKVMDPESYSANGEKPWVRLMGIELRPLGT